jgi:pimeloyl-[acyl-carrier protein] methyl ester esterase
MGATPCFVRKNDWPAAIDASLLHSFSEGLSHDVYGTLKRFTLLQAQGDIAMKSVARKLRDALVRNAPSHLPALIDGLTILSKEDVRPRLSQIPQRTLVLHGENDRLVPLAAAEYLAAALPKGRLVKIEGAAHAPFASAPQRVAQLLLQHFDER